MTDFRALCAELVDIITAHANPDDYAVGYVAGVLTRARAALADGPAVPEGREPDSVTRQPSDEELALIYHDCCRGCEFMDQVGFEDAARAVLTRWGNSSPQPPAEPTVPTVMEIIELSYEIEAAGLGQVDLVRAALTRWGNPAPQPPADGEVAELTGELIKAANGAAAMGWDKHARSILRAADLLQRLSPPQPVQVSERPWEREGWCAEDDRCWVWNRGSCEWWELVDSKLISYSSEDYTHCLPAHALPIPQQQENPQ